MEIHFAGALVYILIALAFILVTLTFGRLIRPSKPSAEKLSTYECGMEPEGPAWIQFNIRFYIIALIFLIFDVEIVLLFPWVMLFPNDDFGWLPFAEMMLFIGILVVGYAYVWVKGDLGWVKGDEETK
ncbi:MAG: NADH-quinone oxidoreductase subunit A [Planctomycetes bacterium RBG_16_59_8]|nr:MAG: NADH-quinone oxidoreductase subunit A [Planctomycetes bacterium RBG_16_59_8]